MKKFSSLDFVKFSKPPPNELFITELIGALKDNELNLISELKKNPTFNTEEREKILFDLYLNIGNISLLLQNFPRALSAYQKGFQHNENCFLEEVDGLYGLGLVYFHFRAYNQATDIYNQLLYLFPSAEVVADVHARLGIAYKYLENYPLALKHLSIALDDIKSISLLSKTQIRFQIANCYDCSGDLKSSLEEYHRLLNDIEKGKLETDNHLVCTVYTRLGVIALLAREKELKEEAKQQKLKEAEVLFCKAIELCPTDSKANCFLGLCFSEQIRILNKSITSESVTTQDLLLQKQQNVDQAAQSAFHNYRLAIDADEADEKNWRSIGILYREQNQPFDALQSFACAVQLDEGFSDAWIEFGNLYETQLQFEEALFCYKKAGKFNTEALDFLKPRILTIEKELKLALQFNDSAPLLAHRLPSVEASFNLGIPAQVRQRLNDLRKQQQIKYRNQNAIPKMTEVCQPQTQIEGEPVTESSSFEALTSTQRQIMEVLKVNKKQLKTENELNLLRYLEEKHESSDASVENETTRQTNSPGRRGKKASPRNSPSKSSKNGGSPDAAKKDASSPGGTEDLHRRSPRLAGTPNVQEEKITSTSSGTSELEIPFFSLLAPLNVPITISSSEIREMCKKRIANPEEAKPIFDEKTPPPKLPIPATTDIPKDKLLLKTPYIIVDNAKEAMMSELQSFCYNSPIALIHGLSSALKIDLSQFSTKSLMQVAGDYEVEVRTQLKMPVDVNVDQFGDPTWAIRSSKSFTSIGRYGQYQAESFKHSLKEETDKLKQIAPKETNESNLPALAHKKRKTESLSSFDENQQFKMIKFGTNVDLSNEKRFHSQLRELNKMPAHLRLASASNLLTYLGHTVLGMNTAQLYMKVPGCRTPGHLENNCFASVNVNIGPGDCEWFGVPYEYWPIIEQMCKEQNIDFLRGAWWPDPMDLIKAKVPFYRFTQKAGDIVWVQGGTVHWVQSLGWCNNVAWNVGPMTCNQMEMALVAHEWNRLNGYRSLVPMQHLCWQLATNVRFSNQKIFNLVKSVLILSLSYMEMVVDFVKTSTKITIKKQQRVKGETAHYCQLCELEVFNVLFVKEMNGKFRVFCFQCTRRNNLEEFVVLQQLDLEHLSLIFDSMKLHPAKSALIC